MKIIIPGELPDLNTYINAERSNKYAGAKLKKEWTNICMYEAKSQCKQKFDKVFIEGDSKREVYVSI